MERWGLVRETLGESSEHQDTGATTQAPAQRKEEIPLDPVKAAVRRRQLELKKRGSNGVDIESREFKQGMSKRRDKDRTPFQFLPSCDLFELLCVMQDLVYVGRPCVYVMCVRTRVFVCV